jgi:hypothetical protein
MTGVVTYKVLQKSSIGPIRPLLDCIFLMNFRRNGLTHSTRHHKEPILGTQPLRHSLLKGTNPRTVRIGTRHGEIAIDIVFLNVVLVAQLGHQEELFLGGGWSPRGDELDALY